MRQERRTSAEAVSSEILTYRNPSKKKLVPAQRELDRSQGEDDLKPDDERKTTYLNNRIDIAKDAFEHIVLIISEQEKRAGFLVTATAFFLTATAALLSNEAIRRLRYSFVNGATVPLPLVFLVLALSLGSLAVLHAVLAIGPQIRHFQHVALRRTSFLSFLSIAERPAQDWQLLAIPTDAELQQYELETYLHETRERAMEAQYKWGRLGEVRAFLFLAVASLSVSLVFVFDALSHTGMTPTRPWSARIALPAASAIWLVTYIAARDRVLSEMDIDAPRGRATAIWTLTRLATWLPLSAGLAMLACNGNSLCLAGSICMLIPPSHAIVVRRHAVESTSFRFLDRVTPPMLVIIIVLYLTLFLMRDARVWLIAAAFLPLLFLEGFRIVDVQIGTAAVLRLLERAGRSSRGKREKTPD